VKIFGIAVMKNEADIVRPLLEHSRTWCDRIFVYDNGSSDGTWEIVQELADEVVVPWKSEDIPFHNNLRSRVFHEFRHEASEGDWWCYRLDADEFYIDNPREFLSRVPKQYHTVYRKCINYRVTIEDAREYEFTGEFAKDQHLVRYFLPEGGVERRFIRHRNAFEWNEKDGTGYTGITYPEMILARHYRWRSPQQIQQRLETKRDFLLRKAVAKDRPEQLGQVENGYKAQNWEDVCPSRSSMILDTGPDSWSKISWPTGKIKRVHESRLSYLVKRVLHAVRILK